jgi:hypothetical protein
MAGTGEKCLINDTGDVITLAVFLVLAAGPGMSILRHIAAAGRGLSADRK